GSSSKVQLTIPAPSVHVPFAAVTDSRPALTGRVISTVTFAAAVPPLDTSIGTFALEPRVTTGTGLGSASAASTVGSGARQLAFAMCGCIWAMLQLEKRSLPLIEADIRNAPVSAAQAEPVSPSCGAPKLWPISCAATRLSKVRLRPYCVSPTPYSGRHSEPL